MLMRREVGTRRHRAAVAATAADLRRRGAKVRTRYERPLGMHCSQSPRWARGVGGAFLGGAVGAILGSLIGVTVGVRKLSDPSASEVAPIKSTITVALGVAIVGTIAGTVAGVIPPEC